MKIENIRLFLLAAQSSSISQAAEAAFVSPQNLSFIIKNLEAELDTQLFIRTNQGISLSSEGERFFPYAKKIVDTYDDFISIRPKKDSKEVIRLFTTPTLASHLKSLQGFCLASGQYISVDKYPADKLLEMLQNNDEGCYFIDVRGELSKKLAAFKDKLIITQSNTIVKLCYYKYKEKILEKKRDECIYMFDSLDVAKTYTKAINVDDFDTSKKLMREKGFVYITTSKMFGTHFPEKEWEVLEERESELVTYTAFFNLKSFHDLEQKKIRNELSALLSDSFA